MSQVYQTRIRRTDGEEYWGFGKERTPHIAVRTELGVDPVSFFAGFNEGLQELGEELIDFELLPDLKVFKTRLLMQNSNEKYTVDSEVYATAYNLVYYQSLDRDNRSNG